MRAGWAAVLVAAILGYAGIAAAGAAVSAVAALPGRARPVESGAHDSAATLGPLAIGALVSDPTGAPIGRVTRVTTDSVGRSVVELRSDEDLFSVPAGMISTHGGRAVSAETLDELKRAGAAH